MLLVLKIIEALLTVIMGVHGIVINSSILAVYIGPWKKITSPSASDQILLSMALTNVLLLCSSSITNCLYYFFAQRETIPTIFFVSFYVVFVLYNLSFWNTAWLSICYCVKLVTVTHQIFLWVKMWFSSSISKLLIGSAMCSVLVNLPFFWTAQITVLQNINITDWRLGVTISVNVPYSVLNMILSYTLPFTLTVICIGLSVTSLLHHVWRVRQNVSQVSSSPQLQALVRAAVTKTLHVVLDLTFLILIMYMFAKSFNPEPVTDTVISLLVIAYPSVQSFVLIFGKPKLKRRLLGQEPTWQ